MLKLKNVRMGLFLAVLLTIFSVVPSAHGGAYPVHAHKRDPMNGCIQNKDGTKDCSNIFLEVGKDQPTLMASCSYYACDGQDPYSAGCAVNYGVIDMRYIYEGSNNIGYVQLWWSNTCQTNWARTVRTSSTTTFSNVIAYVYRDDNNNRVVDTSDAMQGGAGCCSIVYSEMVYAPSRLARARGILSQDPITWIEVWTDWK